MKQFLFILVMAAMGTTVARAQSIKNQTLVPAPSGVFLDSYHAHTVQTSGFTPSTATNLFVATVDWTNAVGGYGSELINGETEVEDFWPTVAWPQWTSAPWESAGLVEWEEDGIGNVWNISTNGGELYPVTLGEHCDVNWNDPLVEFGWQQRTADAEYKLATGGPQGSKQQNLWVISATAWAHTNATDGFGTPVPPQQIQIGSFGNLDTNGNLFVVLPDNNSPTVTAKVPGNPKYTFNAYGTKYTLVSQTVYPALTDTNLSRTTLGVGEQVYLYFTPTPWFVFDWTTTAGSLLAPSAASSTMLTAPSNATPNVTVTATIRGGQSVTFPSFKVVEPTGIDHAQIIGTNFYSAGLAGAGMTNAIWIAPTYVSFYRVNVMEVGEDATNISGYFTQWTPQQLHHTTADHWTQLNWMNSLQDDAFGFDYDEPWSSGSFEWDIPQKWQVVGSNCTNTMSGCNQLFSIDNSGTVTIYKYGFGIQRSTNNVITTQ